MVFHGGVAWGTWVWPWIVDLHSRILFRVLSDVRSWWLAHCIRSWTADRDWIWSTGFTCSSQYSDLASLMGLLCWPDVQPSTRRDFRCTRASCWRWWLTDLGATQLIPCTSKRALSQPMLFSTLHGVSSSIAVHTVRTTTLWHWSQFSFTKIHHLPSYAFLPVTLV